MPLQQLVEYFNDRFEREHHASFRPFLLKKGLVTGLFGAIRINSCLTPLRLAFKSSHIVGHTAAISVTTQVVQHLYSYEIENLLMNSARQANEFESIINFDRLTRTVHLLNYLPLSHLQQVLFLEVDPRHILGIKQDHGAYFEEVILRCGLETRQVVITLAVNSSYGRYSTELITGLHNYRRHGYGLALKVEQAVLKDEVIELIRQAEPEYVCLSQPNLDQGEYAEILKALSALRAIILDVGGKSIIQHVENETVACLARTAGFDIVQGSYYEQLRGESLQYAPHLGNDIKRVVNGNTTN